MNSADYHTAYEEDTVAHDQTIQNDTVLAIHANNPVAQDSC